MKANVASNHPLATHPVRAWRARRGGCGDTAVQGEAGTKCPAGTAITAATRSALQSLLSESRPLTAAPHLAAAVIERSASREAALDALHSAQPDLGGICAVLLLGDFSPIRPSGLSYIGPVPAALAGPRDATGLYPHVASCGPAL